MEDSIESKIRKYISLHWAVVLNDISKKKKSNVNATCFVNEKFNCVANETFICRFVVYSTPWTFKNDQVYIKFKVQLFDRLKMTEFLPGLQMSVKNQKDSLLLKSNEDHFWPSKQYDKGYQSN